MICRSLEIQGKIDPDRSILSFLKDELNENVKSTYKNVSLRQVLTHRSGLGRSMKAYSKDDIINALNTIDLEFTPGEKFQYSNYGYALVTYILEQETNKSYSELLKEHIAEPLGLSDFYCEKESVPEDRLVTPYSKHFRIMKGITPDFGIQIGASGVFTDTKTLAMLAIKQMEAYNHFDSLKNSSPLILTYPKDTLWNKDNFYGYGLFEFTYELDEIPGIKHVNLEHGGDLDGFSTMYDFLPSCQCGVVIHTSSGGNWINNMTWQINKLLTLRHYNK